MQPQVWAEVADRCTLALGLQHSPPGLHEGSSQSLRQVFPFFSTAVKLFGDTTLEHLTGPHRDSQSLIESTIQGPSLLPGPQFSGL
jgi:hypothetical protein